MAEQIFDKQNVIEKMRAFIDRRNEDIFNYNQKYETELIKLHEVKYLGKCGFTVEGKEELVEKDVFMTVEELDGTFQFKYYDEDNNLLGVQKSIDQEIMLSMSLSAKENKEQERIKRELSKRDKEEAKTLDELEKEQEQEQKTKGQETEKEEQNSPKEANGLQLTKAQIDNMPGPKTKLNQKTNGTTLANIIGLSGEYIKFVDADALRSILPDAKLPATNQRNIPIEVFSDGTANIISEDIIQYSSIEGRNSATEQTTVTNGGLVTAEQNIETFNISKSGGTQTIAISYDENYDGKEQQEIKFGERDRTDPTKIAYTELESVHTDPKRDDDTAYYLRDAGDGVKKGEETIDRATQHERCGEELEAEDVDSNPNNNNIHEEDVQRYAEAFNIRVCDEHGYPTGQYDLDEARRQLEEKLIVNPDASIEEIIEDNVKTIGPEDNKRY